MIKESDLKDGKFYWVKTKGFNPFIVEYDKETKGFYKTESTQKVSYDKIKEFLLQEVSEPTTKAETSEKANELIPDVMGMCCPYCGSDDIVWYGLSGDCVCNKCGEEGNITL